MTNDGSSQTDQPQQAPWPLAVLQFTKEYFVPLSALAIVSGIVLATVYLYGYLSVFDWHLIWVVQYPDVLGFALIAVGVIAGFATLIPALVENVVYSGLPKGQANWLFVAVSIAAFIAILGLNVYGEYKSLKPHYFRISMAGGLVFMMACLAFTIGRHAHFHYWPTPWGATWIFASAIAGAFLFGQWLGYSISEQRGLDYDVYLKHETLNGVRVVMAMSHHMILCSNKTIYIIPTDDVVRIAIPYK
jgi:hypothetical protein